MPAKQQARLRALSAAQRGRALAPAELQKLDALLQEYGRIRINCFAQNGFPFWLLAT
jgi:hypothetical protein